MPILQFHLPESLVDAGIAERLLLEGGRCFADCLDAPIERVRVFISPYPAGYAAVGGRVQRADSLASPYFVCTIMAGRPVEQRHRILRTLTDVVVRVLDCERGLVRGCIQHIEPDNWGIAGVPASVARAAEVSARAGSPS